MKYIFAACVFYACIVFFGVLLAAEFYNLEKYPPTCTQSSKVASIDSLDYRDATITLADGKHFDVNQATLKPGDDFCEVPLEPWGNPISN